MRQVGEFHALVLGTCSYDFIGHRAFADLAPHARSGFGVLAQRCGIRIYTDDIGAVACWLGCNLVACACACSRCALRALHVDCLMQRHMKFEEEEMLLNTRDLVGYRLTATDGAIGIIDDLLIDDRDWTIRWITVDTGNWLHSRKVLLPPQSFGEPDHLGREIPIDLDRKRIEQSPTVARDHPVSRQVEADIYAFYDYPPYWSQVSAKPIAGVVGNMPLASIGTRAFDNAQAQQAVPAAPSEALITDTIGHGQDYPHLRSTNEMMGYYIEAKDGSIGHVEDILIEGHG